jgi:mannonate dehydratase
MNLTLLLPAKPDDRWVYARQIGVRHAVTKLLPAVSGIDQPWTIDALRTVRDRFAEAQIELVGLEGDPFDMTRIKWGQNGREEDYDRYRQLLENMARLELRLLCYNFMPRPQNAAHDWLRTRTDVPLRGGSLSTAFDQAKLPPVATSLSCEQLWANYRQFIEAVMPTAEQVGVRMSLHPDDPPVASLGGVARIFNSVENFDKAYQLHPCRANALTFCQANFKLMGVDLPATVRHFAEDDRIAFVHWRDVQGSAEQFTETWHDEGPTDMAAMLGVYHEAGFAGPIRDDHVPLMHGEAVPDMPGYGALGHLFTMGYLKGALAGKGIAYR